MVAAAAVVIAACGATSSPVTIEGFDATTSPPATSASSTTAAPQTTTTIAPPALDVSSQPPAWDDVTITTEDGFELYARHWAGVPWRSRGPRLQQRVRGPEHHPAPELRDRVAVQRCPGPIRRPLLFVGSNAGPSAGWSRRMANEALDSRGVHVFERTSSGLQFIDVFGGELAGRMAAFFTEAAST